MGSDAAKDSAQTELWETSERRPDVSHYRPAISRSPTAQGAALPFEDGTKISSIHTDLSGFGSAYPWNVWRSPSLDGIGQGMQTASSLESSGSGG